MNILVAVNRGQAQADALALAASLAGTEGHLVVAHVYAWSSWAERAAPAYARELAYEADDVLRAAREQLGDTPCETVAVPGTSVPRALHALAQERGADLLVVGAAHRSRPGRALLGDIGGRVVAGAPCPVAVAPCEYAAERHEVQRIGVAYDGGADADAALHWAIDLAEATHGSVVVLQAFHAALPPSAPAFGVYPDDVLTTGLRTDAERSIEAAVRRVPAGERPEGRVLSGTPTAVLARESKGLDLLVAGSRGYGPAGTLLLGSVSRALMRRAACPVVVVPRSSAESHPAGDGAGAVAAA